MAAIEWSWSRLMEFMIQSAHQLEVSPIVKYSALSLFADRFCPSLTRYTVGSNGKGNWLLQPIRESNLQLFALIALWISSKIHDSRPVSVKSFKSLGDKIIKDEHFTTRDFLEAEIVFMQVLDFEIGTSNIAFLLLEELLLQFKGVAKVGELLRFEACMDIMDLLYEKEETSTLYRSPRSLAASILIASYLITVPKQRWEFPILPWVGFVTSCKEENIVELVQEILKLVFEPR
ncbi:cyclin-J18 isoform X3 [Citrus sinensis]|uniref:cyclin-J18 isoform X3 n=1 Tax=Citrus sinensis TaxID=2711 RepID=UPI0003D6EDDB|nr:cyclin-J18 isoform X3 [Citrus sinensis]